MTFIVRQAKIKDLDSLLELTRQFTLLNLPSNLSVLEGIVLKSQKSFQGALSKDKATYMFVIEDTETQKVVASSLILAKHGSEDEPHYSFEIHCKEHFSKDIGVGFKHNILRFKENKDGPTEIGGLLLDKAYRSRPEKLGKLISYSRFIYMAMYPERFQSEVLCELSPPLTSEGRSEFWEALGRRFTGLPYVEADQISQTSKEFIPSLFPKEDIYISLLDAKARLDIGRVAEATKPAKHMLEKIGFEYLNEIDPFDGGPHYGAKLEEISIVKESRKYKITSNDETKYELQGIVAVDDSNGFRASFSAYAEKDKNQVSLPEHIQSHLSIKEKGDVYIYKLS